MEGVSPSSSVQVQVQDRGKEPIYEEGHSGGHDIDVALTDVEKTEIDRLNEKLLKAECQIKYLEQRNKQLEDEHTLIELQRIHEDRRLARKRPGDLTPIARKFVLEKGNRHLEGLLAKANRDKDLLRHMKNHYWARMHVCKAKMKILKRRLSKALKRRKKPDPLQILAEACLTGHSN